MLESTSWQNIAPQKLVVDPSAMSSLAARTLFYPCSGGDWENVIPLFLPHVRDFWFVDTEYRRKPTGYLQYPATWGLSSMSEPTIERVNLPRDEIEDDSKYRACEPFVQTERFRHESSEDEVSIQWVMRRGPSALRSLIVPLGVFLYRGDSDEGGSGTRWLVGRRRYGQLLDVLQRLVHGGLIITDGSNSHGVAANPYQPLSAFLGRRDVSPAEAAREAKRFSHDGRSFDCVGYIDADPQRYKGPVLVWRVA